MEKEIFEEFVAEAFGKIPERFRKKLKNVALLVEDEPSPALRKEEALDEGETLLGHYRGIPNTVRGSGYGVGPTVPDTITIFRIPNEREARETGRNIKDVVYETVWHEVAHYLGMDEDEVTKREQERFDYM